MRPIMFQIGVASPAWISERREDEMGSYRAHFHKRETNLFLKATKVLVTYPKQPDTMVHHQE